MAVNRRPRRGPGFLCRMDLFLLSYVSKQRAQQRNGTTWSKSRPSRACGGRSAVRGVQGAPRQDTFISFRRPSCPGGVPPRSPQEKMSHGLGLARTPCKADSMLSRRGGSCYGVHLCVEAFERPHPERYLTRANKSPPKTDTRQYLCDAYISNKHTKLYWSLPEIFAAGLLPYANVLCC